jgi:hypothetical protein
MPNVAPDGGPRRRRWLAPQMLLAGTAVVAVAAGAGIALAATSSPSTSSPSAGALSDATSSPAAQSPVRACARVVTPLRAGIMCRRAGLGGVLHGTLVLPKAGGGTVTVEIQNGKVASVSQSSITLKSTDGFTKTYAVTASTIVDAQRDGIDSVKVGDQVWVAATVSGGTVTAVRVRDLTQLGADNPLHPGIRPAAGNLPGTSSGSPGGMAASFFGGSAGG